MQILDDLLTLLDLLTVWDVGNEWREMEQLGLRILLAFAAQKHIAVCFFWDETIYMYHRHEVIWNILWFNSNYATRHLLLLL